MNYKPLQKVVADTVGLPYSPHINRLDCLTSLFYATQLRGVLRKLANLIDPMRGGNLSTGSTSSKGAAQ